MKPDRIVTKFSGRVQDPDEVDPLLLHRKRADSSACQRQEDINAETITEGRTFPARPDPKGETP